MALHSIDKRGFNAESSTLLIDLHNFSEIKFPFEIERGTIRHKFNIKKDSGKLREFLDNSDNLSRLVFVDNDPIDMNDYAGTMGDTKLFLFVQSADNKVTSNVSIDVDVNPDIGLKAIPNMTYIRNKGLLFSTVSQYEDPDLFNAIKNIFIENKDKIITL